MGESKTCSACREAKPLEAFRRAGKASYCVPCEKSYQRSYYLSNQERIKAQTTAWRKSNPERKRANDAAYAVANREKVNALSVEWSRRNPEKRKAVYTKSRADNLEHTRGREAAYRAGNRAECNARVRVWKQANKDRAVGYFHKRRAIQLQAVPSWANPEAIAVIYARAQELRDEAGRTYHVDHIVPLISPLVCGLHCEANLEPIPPDVNLSKNNRRWPDMP